ncbi:MAG TPA: hypothetical protein VGM37_04985 [Armatimonadota bacterium]|jgi:hypothetical protein
MITQTQAITAPAVIRARTKTISLPRVADRPLADRLEWAAAIVLPLASLVAAVSLLGQAIR